MIFNNFITYCLFWQLRQKICLVVALIPPLQLLQIGVILIQIVWRHVPCLLLNMNTAQVTYLHHQIQHRTIPFFALAILQPPTIARQAYLVRSFLFCRPNQAHFHHFHHLHRQKLSSLHI